MKSKSKRFGGLDDREGRREYYLGEFDFVFELMESIIEAAEGINVLLVLPRHLHLRSTTLPLHIIIHTHRPLSYTIAIENRKILS